jgi:flagellar biosynthesis/type III secretory pathway chaperone
MGSDNELRGRQTGGEGRIETDLLAELISKKHHVLEQLRELSRRQSDLIGQGEMTKLLAVLSVKQKLLVDLQRLERRLDPFRDQEPASRRWRSPEHRERSRQIAERCETLLGEIMLIEKQCESELIQRRDEAAARLQGAHAAAQARSAYGQSLRRTSRQLDLTSDM